ncbi:MAG: thioredoxin family protein [Burkholderiales bacterium]|nr:thioredoxin family protein [Burkholderiales bacterium]MDW8468188.1 thioredoxin family protein [Burkholderiales bacterium]
MRRLLALALFAALAAQAATVGAPAPDFALENAAGGTVTLAQQRGKYVVLEWVNPECPYVRKHYASGNMQRLQKEAAARGIVWLSINSTRAGHPEHKSAAEMAAWMKRMDAAPTATLLDPKGEAGRAYGARTTPHMYIVDPKGVLVYAGAIDDRRSTDPEDVKTAKNYVRAALDELLAGRPVSTPSTPPYGCSVKY